MHLGAAYIVGFGKAGQAHYRELVENDESISADITIVELANAVTRLQKKFPSVEFISIEAFLGLDDVNAMVLLCIPPSQMTQFLEQICRKSWQYRLLIEKPGPWPYGDATLAIKAIESQGQTVRICHQRQYSDHFSGVSQAFGTKKISSRGIATLHLEKWDYRSAGTHWMAFTHACFGAPVNWRGAVFSNELYAIDHRYPIESIGAIDVEHENGTLVHWNLGGRGHRSDFRFFSNDGFAEVKVTDDPLARIVTSDFTKEFRSYGYSRARLLKDLHTGVPPRVGCNVDDLGLYLKIYDESLVEGIKYF